MCTEPLAKAVQEVVARERLSFHMPGHCSGRGLPVWPEGWFGCLDTTELPDTDNLAHPEGMLLAAQEQAAAVFGAARTHFLVNGSTGGILAMLQATVGPGDTLLVGRDCHRSVLNGLRLCGASAIPISARGHRAEFLPCGPSETDWLEAVAAHPDARALWITRPNYYGVAVSLTRIARAAQAAGMLLLVDEAHGAHFMAHKAFPESALACGADLVVQSLHKTLPAPTQTAVLHVSKNWIGVRNGLPVRSVGEAVALFQTTSPSWVLLSLMDAAVSWLAREGPAAYERLLETLRNGSLPDRVRDDILRLEEEAVPCGFHKDPTRIVLRMRGAGILLERGLRQRHGIVVEMADPDHLVLIVTPFHTEGDFALLNTALEEVVADINSRKPAFSDVRARASKDAQMDIRAGADAHTPSMACSTRTLTLADVAVLTREQVPLAQAAGHIAAMPVVPYPPGVAVLLPGETYGTDTVEQLLGMREAGVTLNGMDADGQVWCIKGGIPV